MLLLGFDLEEYEDSPLTTVGPAKGRFWRLVLARFTGGSLQGERNI
jgi:hypothetical protein